MCVECINNWAGPQQVEATVDSSSSVKTRQQLNQLPATPTSNLPPPAPTFPPYTLTACTLPRPRMNIDDMPHANSKLTLRCLHLGALSAASSPPSPPPPPSAGHASCYCLPVASFDCLVAFVIFCANIMRKWCSIPIAVIYSASFPSLCTCTCHTRSTLSTCSAWFAQFQIIVWSAAGKEQWSILHSSWMLCF